MPLLYGGSYNQKRGKVTGGGGYDNMFSQYELAPQASLEDLTKKHLANIPRADIPRDPEKIYENIMGPARADVQGAQEKIGLGLQKFATGGSSYEDMLSRYLPGATEQMADVASKAGVAGQEFAQKGAVAQSQADIARQNVAKDMAIVEKEIQEDSRRFMLDLKARIEMADREIRAKERIALQGARSAEHIARIRANTDLERSRIAANAQMETTKYAQNQENFRNTQRMQVYDKWYTGQTRIAERRENRLGTEFASRFPNVRTSGKPLPDPAGFGNLKGAWSPKTYTYPATPSKTPGGLPSQGGASSQDYYDFLKKAEAAYT